MSLYRLMVVLPVSVPLPELVAGLNFAGRLSSVEVEGIVMTVVSGKLVALVMRMVQFDGTE